MPLILFAKIRLVIPVWGLHSWNLDAPGNFNPTRKDENTANFDHKIKLIEVFSVVLSQRLTATPSRPSGAS
jgi:hypothetical protein